MDVAIIFKGLSKTILGLPYGVVQIGTQDSIGHTMDDGSQGAVLAVTDQ